MSFVWTCIGWNEHIWCPSVITPNSINIQQPKPAGAVIPASRSSEINPPGHTSLWCSSCCYSYRTQTVITGSTWFAPSCPEITYICILAHSVWCMTNQRCKQKNCARYWTRLHGSEHTQLQCRCACLLIEQKLKHKPMKEGERDAVVKNTQDEVMCHHS